MSRGRRLALGIVMIALTILTFGPPAVSEGLTTSPTPEVRVLALTLFGIVLVVLTFVKPKPEADE